MSVASLTRFTVPLNTSSSSSTQGLLMPKLQYRFRVSFESFGVSPEKVELTKQVMSFARPSVSFGDIDVHVYNSLVRLAGKPTWADTSVTLRDDAAGNVSRLVGEQLQKQFDFMEQSSAASGSDYKFITRLEMLDGGNGADEPAVLETWELYGCFIHEANYQEVNYANNEVVQIQLGIRFDNALQESGEGVGTPVGRNQGDMITGVSA